MSSSYEEWQAAQAIIEESSSAGFEARLANPLFNKKVYPDKPAIDMSPQANLWTEEDEPPSDMQCTTFKLTLQF